MCEKYLNSFYCIFKKVYDKIDKTCFLSACLLFKWPEGTQGDRLLQMEIWQLKSLKQLVSGRLHPFFIAEQSSMRLMRETKLV